MPNGAQLLDFSRRDSLASCDESPFVGVDGSIEAAEKAGLAGLRPQLAAVGRTEAGRRSAVCSDAFRNSSRNRCVTVLHACSAALPAIASPGRPEIVVSRSVVARGRSVVLNDADSVRSPVCGPLPRPARMRAFRGESRRVVLRKGLDSKGCAVLIGTVCDDLTTARRTAVWRESSALQH